MPGAFAAGAGGLAVPPPGVRVPCTKGCAQDEVDWTGKTIQARGALRYRAAVFPLRRWKSRRDTPARYGLGALRPGKRGMIAVRWCGKKSQALLRRGAGAVRCAVWKDAGSWCVWYLSAR